MSNCLWHQAAPPRPHTLRPPCLLCSRCLPCGADLRSADDVARLRALYDTATQDYLSVPIWLSYLQ